MPIYEIIDDNHETFAGPVPVVIEIPPELAPGKVPDPSYAPLSVTFIGHFYDTRTLRDDTPATQARKQRIVAGLDEAVERCQAEADIKGWPQLQPGQIRYAPEQDRKVVVRESELEAMRQRIAELEAEGRGESLASVQVETEAPRSLVKERVIRVTPQEAKKLRENRKTYSSGPCEVCGKMTPLNSMIAHWRLSGLRGKTMQPEHAARYAMYEAERDAQKVAV